MKESLYRLGSAGREKKEICIENRRKESRELEILATGGQWRFGGMNKIFAKIIKGNFLYGKESFKVLKETAFQLVELAYLAKCYGLIFSRRKQNLSCGIKKLGKSEPTIL